MPLGLLQTRIHGGCELAQFFVQMRIEEYKQGPITRKHEDSLLFVLTKSSYDFLSLIHEISK